MTVYQDMSYEYDGTPNTHSKFQVDSHRARNTNDNINSLREYCIEKSGCDDVPPPPMSETEYQELRALETVERAMSS